MKRRMVLTLALWAGLASAESHWVYFMTTQEDYREYTDANSWQLSGDRTDAGMWVKSVHPNGSFNMWHFELDRHTKMCRILSVTIYDAKGARLHADSTPSDWRDVVPDSVAYGLFDLAFNSGKDQ